MAAFETNELSGSLFINKRKDKPSQPDRQGECKIDGKMYRMSGWLRDTKSGDKWLSLAFTLKEEPKTPTKDTPGYQDLDDDIPF